MFKKSPTIVKREVVYNGPAFSVYKYTIQLDDKIVQRDIIERAHGVVVVPVDVDHNVLLIREYCAGSNSFILSLPGGSMEDGDASPAQQAMRELREETGYTAREMIKLHYAFSHPSTSNRKSYTFLGYDLKWDPLPKTDEIIEVVKLPLEEAIIRVYRDFQSDVSTIGNLLMASDKLKELGL